jgi:NAD(P)H dehydrogenase (quinone)
MTKPRAMITGATGQIGSAVLRLAAANPTLDVVAAVRLPQKAAALGVPVVLLDLDRPETLAPALEGVDRVFLMTGYTTRMFKQSRDFLNAARRADVEHIVHLGAPGDDDTPVEHWLWHQFVERYIEWSGFSFTHLRPDIFMQNLLDYGGAKAAANGVIRHYVANTRMTWIDGDDVAAVAVECLSKPEDHAEKTYRLGAEVRSFAEIAEIMTRVVGKSYVSEHVAPCEFLAKALAAGANAGYMQSVYENYAAYTEGTRKGEEKLFSSFADVVGRQPASVEDFIRKHIDAFAY